MLFLDFSIISFFNKRVFVVVIALDELEATRMDFDICTSIFNEYLLTTLAKYFSKFVPFFAVHGFIVNRISCYVFDITWTSDVVG